MPEPQPTREQFEAAAKRVIANAPPGLSRDEFFGLITRELQGQRLKTVGADEPTEYWPGFFKGLKEAITPSFSGVLDMMESMAYPHEVKGHQEGSRWQSAKDMAPFLIPAGVEGAIGGAGNTAAQLRLVGQEAGELNRMGVGKFQSLTKALAGRFKDPMTTGERMLQKQPFRLVGPEEAPTRYGPNIPAEQPTPPQGQMPIPQGNINDLPLWKQQEIMDAMGSQAGGSSVRGGGPIASGRETAPVGTPPRVAGKAPTLQEELKNALIEQMGGSDAPISTSLGPDIETAGEVALKQSGKFGKSGSAGQPGGYSSGRPGVTEAGYGEFADRADALDDLRERVMSGWKPKPAEPPGIEDVLRDIEYDPGAMAGQAQDLRSLVGSRDAAREMFGTATPQTQGWIRTMAPGPSRMPSTAQDRIDEVLRRILEGEER